MKKVTTIILALIAAVTTVAAQTPQSEQNKSNPQRSTTAYVALNGLRVSKITDADGKVCAIRIDPRTTKATPSMSADRITDAELKSVLDELVPAEERGKFVHGTFLNISCAEVHGNDIRPKECGGVNERYERLEITRIGNTNSYHHVTVVYFRPSCEDSAMTRMRVLFDAAEPAKPENLLGEWVAVKEVWTENFLTGRTGPDHIEADENGIRRRQSGEYSVGRPRSVEPGHSLDWKLTFRAHGESIQAVSDVPWPPTGDVSNVRFAANGDFVFDKDYGGDSMWSYRCRAVDPQRIVCLLKEAEGHGVEFRKLEGQQPSP